VFIVQNVQGVARLWVVNPDISYVLFIACVY